MICPYYHHPLAKVYSRKDTSKCLKMEQGLCNKQQSIYTQDRWRIQIKHLLLYKDRQDLRRQETTNEGRNIESWWERMRREEWRRKMCVAVTMGVLAFCNGLEVVDFRICALKCSAFSLFWFKF